MTGEVVVEVAGFLLAEILADLDGLVNGLGGIRETSLAPFCSGVTEQSQSAGAGGARFSAYFSPVSHIRVRCVGSQCRA